MPAYQLSFTLRTSANVKAVHLIGSWDNYTGKIPLSVSASGKAGSWQATPRFSSSLLAPGSRYWYYYHLDGHHVSHDPAKESVREPTTGRLLNILDVPAAAAGGRAAPASTVPQGRPISPSRIAHPKPSKPYASRRVREADYSQGPEEATDELTATLEAATLRQQRTRGSPSSSLSGFSSGRSSSGPDSPASLSSLSDASASSCRCNRYGITRSGNKVLLDCGGRRCGYSDDDSSSGCASDESRSEIDESSDEEESEESEDERPVVRRIAPKAAPKVAPRIVQAAPRQAAKTSSGRRR